MTTETKGRSNMASCPVGREWSSWCDLSCDGGLCTTCTDGSHRPGKSCSAERFQCTVFAAAPCCCCCCTRTWRAGSVLQQTLALFPPMTPLMIWLVRYTATLQNRQRAKSNSDVKIMNVCPLPTPLAPPRNSTEHSYS
jgi:hypothetical protein